MQIVGCWQVMREVVEKYSLRQKIGLGLGVTIFLLILIWPRPEGLSAPAQRTAAVAGLMSVWWMSEALPLAATSLVPIILFPFLSVQPVGGVAASYADKNIFLFLGGFFIAMAMQRWDLHRRMALWIIRLVGTNPRRIILGFMLATAFLSMWISNTATTMMMMPIGLAVILHVRREIHRGQGEGLKGFDAALMLGIAYAASIGGIGTLIGTPPNIIFASAVRNLFPSAPEVGFFQWMKVGFPLVVLFLPLTWVFLTRVIFPIRLKQIPGGRGVIEGEYRKLGPMNRGEKMVLTVFLTTALAWIFRRPIDIGGFTLPGWTTLLGVENFVDDATVAVAAAVLLFILPVDLPRGEFALNWEWAKRIPWDILILFGGGLALAKGFQITGLAQWIGGSLHALASVSTLLIIVTVAFMLTFLTEITSNTATANIFMPILGALSLALKAHPFLLMVPATISASCAFMLPVATPPNAIVFGSGVITIPQMARAGFGLNLIGIVMVTTLTYLIAIPVFGIVLGQIPLWVK